MPVVGERGRTYRESRLELDRAGMTYDLVVTQRAGEGIDIGARAARAGFEPVIAGGGDSTCSEVINGLVAAAGDAPTTLMGIIPLGTANDLAFGVGIPNEVEPAVEVIARRDPNHRRRPGE
jgi:diacylglycerol kinase (ATP)